ncbi:HTH-type transcriptional regulator CdhR (plasmid) [Pseudoseohaeicola sp. NH-UV-7]|uniref:GlxA family transcriptional regulator n=1 Tax=unclassified Sulfitobacter TaxID=196795 RepID=UPI000E0BDEE3|nr:GlxA family transcriptional regulator [Sulfitobacter sp. JL08]AXI56855.1 AraC family transcriptional regulator [Sulfitobacter sp. JL08]
MNINLDGTSGGARGQSHAIFVVVPRFNIATLITTIETMRIANYLSSIRAFSWEIVSFDGASITASNGMKTEVNADTDSLGPADLIFVLGSWGTEHYANKSLISWLRKRARQGERVCSVELGCYIVARAGLLAGKSATTHWSWMSGFQESFDTVQCSEQLFTIGDKVMTCAGGLAGVDLMLRLIEKSHGSSFAGEIADQMLHHPIRTETTPQRRTMGQGTETMAPVVRQAIRLIERNIEEPLGVPEIARSLGISQRQLERQFKKYIGCTVIQFSLLMRLQNARVLLISTKLSVREIATASGFNTLSHFAYSFGKFFGRRPSEYREAWPQNEAAPTWPGTLSEFLNTRPIKARKS